MTGKPRRCRRVGSQILNDTISLTVTLTDKYTTPTGIHYLTGIQALVRLPIDRMRADRAAGLRTGAFISGYEGSPLGGYDLALARIKNILDGHNIHARPGVNEDLAATAILGSQIHHVAGASKVDGVVGIWYGKGPGVDRSHDAFRHANLAGCPGHSAALVLAGDDPTSKSSTIPHQSDFSLMNLGIPTLMPGNTQEVLDLGLAAIAMSRYSGAWCGLKLVTNVCDGGGSVEVGGVKPFVLPEGYAKVTDPMLVIPHTLRMEVELGRRMQAAQRFARANRLDRIVGNPAARIGIATAGKPYYDVLDALRLLGMADDIRIAKYALTFPIDPEFTREFARDLDVLIVVEEKRSFLEMQLREVLFNEPSRPKVHGKDLLPYYGELSAETIAAAVGPILGKHFETTIAASASKPWRPPNFCSGCPHNRSTILLEGQMAGGGTGCHGMAVMLGAAGRGFAYATHMGGEGAPWIGMAPFSERKHMFQNIGDGTYFHSGSLAIQACVAAGVNITFKILYNGHVAMTGGQDAQGALPVPELTRELEAKGVRRTVVLVEDVERYASERQRFASTAQIRDRIELTDVLRELEVTPGVTAMIYDQECAAEKRRKRSRGKMATPTKRLVIHEEVCEGCGDCRVKSNCASLQTVATAKGEKMRIHQSSCNLDYTCALGDCPSFLTVESVPAERKKQMQPPPTVDPPARIVELGVEPYRILMPGVGGTGVVTINAILATAAVADGLDVVSLDQTGLAQKGGAVTSHLTLSRAKLDIAARIVEPDLALGFDPAGVDLAARVRVLNTPIPGTLNVDAAGLAEDLLGSHVFVNMFLTGFAWQGGLIPISLTSIEHAIRLNAVQVEGNLAAFAWGRAHYGKPPQRQEAPVARIDYAAELTAYQNEAYAKRHADFVARMPEAIRDLVARNLYKLMAYKDEYEVARLLTKPGYEGVTYNLHPPMFRAYGLKRKIQLGPWFRPVLQGLASLKFLRGGALDPFGWMRHRREERELIDWYKNLIAANLDHPAIAELAALPDSIRGYDEVKSRSIVAAKRKAEQLCAPQVASPVSLPS